jgi:hypothetical protein
VTLFNDIEKIIEGYEILLMNYETKKYCLCEPEKKWFEADFLDYNLRQLVKFKDYFLKVKSQLNKLDSFPHRKKELFTIAIFLQGKSTPRDFQNLKEIFQEYGNFK